MEKILVIGLGGFAGAVARYQLSGLVQRLLPYSFPSGTLVVNLMGCFLIGAFMHLVEDRQLFSPSWRLFLSIGLLGAFTTFSTLSYETFELLADREISLALLNAGANVILGLVCVLLGQAVMKLV